MMHGAPVPSFRFFVYNYNGTEYNPFDSDEESVWWLSVLTVAAQYFLTESCNTCTPHRCVNGFVKGRLG
jgi:hypothetical protein